MMEILDSARRLTVLKRRFHELVWRTQTERLTATQHRCINQITAKIASYERLLVELCEAVAEESS